MAKFIEIEDSNGAKRLINVNHISDIFDNYVYLDTFGGYDQAHIRCNHGYEELKRKLTVAGVEIY